MTDREPKAGTGMPDTPSQEKGTLKQNAGRFFLGRIVPFVLYVGTIAALLVCAYLIANALGAAARRQIVDVLMLIVGMLTMGGLSALRSALDIREHKKGGSPGSAREYPIRSKRAQQPERAPGSKTSDPRPP